MPHALKKSQKTEFMKENVKEEIDTAKEIVIGTVIVNETETGNVVDIEKGKLLLLSIKTYL